MRSSIPDGRDAFRSAACSEMMCGTDTRRSRWGAQFEVLKGNSVTVGLVPAALLEYFEARGDLPCGWCWEPGVYMWDSLGPCHGGKQRHPHIRSWSSWESDWEGQAGYNEGDTVGLVLDYEDNGGTLTAYKNNVRLGVLVPNEREPSLGPGPFCWAVDVMGQGCAVRFSWSIDE